jgi:TolA-binding protein
MSAIKFHSRVNWNSNKSSDRSGEQKSMPPDEGLYNIGVYYFHKSKLQEAKYVFGKYLQSYPDGKYTDDIKRRLFIMEGKV